MCVLRRFLDAYGKDMGIKEQIHRVPPIINSAIASLSESKSPLMVNLPFAMPIRLETGVSSMSEILATGFPFLATVMKSGLSDHSLSAILRKTKRI